MDEIRNIYEALGTLIERMAEVNKGPDRSRELSVAITQAETAFMWLQRAEGAAFHQDQARG